MRTDPNDVPPCGLMAELVQPPTVALHVSKVEFPCYTTCVKVVELKIHDVNMLCSFGWGSQRVRAVLDGCLDGFHGTAI